MSAAVVFIAAKGVCRRTGLLGLASTAENLGSLYLWLAATLLLLTILGLIGAFILKCLRAPTDSGVGPAFSLAELRSLRDQGQLNDEEYERARSRVLAQMTAGPPSPEANPEAPSDNPQA